MLEKFFTAEDAEASIMAGEYIKYTQRVKRYLFVCFLCFVVEPGVNLTSAPVVEIGYLEPSAWNSTSLNKPS